MRKTFSDRMKPPEHGWYRPDWQTETIVDVDGMPIPVDATEVNRNGLQIKALYRDDNGKVWPDYQTYDCVTVVLRKKHQVIKRLEPIEPGFICETNLRRVKPTTPC